MIDKDLSIVDLIETVKMEDHSERLTTIDFWDADRCAIGFANKDVGHKLVYVSSYKKLEGYYDYECEATNPHVSDDYEVIERGSNLRKEDLIMKIQDFLLEKE